LKTYLQADGIVLNEQQDATLNTAKEVLAGKKDVPMDMDHWQSLLGKGQNTYTDRNVGLIYVLCL
jgi:hypothetical protein